MDLLYKDHNYKLTQENRALQDEIRSLRQQLSELCRRIPEYETALGKSQHKCTELLAQLDQEKDSAFSAMASASAREARYARQEETIESLQQEFNSLQEELRSVSQQLHEEATSHEFTKQQLETTRRESTEMHVQMDAMKADALKLQAEISEHKSAALRAQQDVEAAKRDRDECHRQLQSVSRELIEMKHSFELDKLELQRSYETMLSREKETHAEMIRHLKDSLMSYPRDDRRVSSYISPGPAMFPSGSTGLYSGPVAPTGVVHEHHSTSIPSTHHQHSHRSHRKHCHRSKSPERSRSPHQYRRSSSTPEQEIPSVSKDYRIGFMDALSSPACAPALKGSSITHTTQDSTSLHSQRRNSCIDAPNLRRQRKGIGALPVDRSLDGDLIATCRRRHCLRRFNVNDNVAAACGYHPVKAHTSFDGDFYSCCGILVKPGAPNVYCQFRPHLA